MLGRIEADDPNRVLILPFEHIHDDRFEVSLLGVGLAVGPAVAAEIVQNDIDILIVAPRHDRRGPTGLTHVQNPNATKPALIKPALIEIVPHVGTCPSFRYFLSIVPKYYFDVRMDIGSLTRPASIASVKPQAKEYGRKIALLAADVLTSVSRRVAVRDANGREAAVIPIGES